MREGDEAGPKDQKIGSDAEGKFIDEYQSKYSETQNEIQEHLDNHVRTESAQKSMVESENQLFKEESSSQNTLKELKGKEKELKKNEHEVQEAQEKINQEKKEIEAQIEAKAKERENIH